MSSPFTLLPQFPLLQCQNLHLVGKEKILTELWLAPVTLTTGDVQQVTVHRWHPEVGGARVKDHSELLWWGPDANLTIILGLQRRRREP